MINVKGTLISITQNCRNTVVARSDDVAVIVSDIKNIVSRRR